MNYFNYQQPDNKGAQLVAELEEKISRYARVPFYVLITGQRGTGKTTIARRLHEASSRANKEFINLNCASLTQELLESELFGYEKGAFTGATAPKAGLFEIANGGTLFLDEIGEIPLSLQAKLLKAVEEKRIRRVGSNAERPVDTRIIAATSANLKEMVEKGSFRADLYDRLNILTLETVPLKYQKEKIKEILEADLKKECSAIGRTQPFEISRDALEMIKYYDWEGNFRELHNFATRIAVECLDESVISVETVAKILGDKIKDFVLTESGETEINNISHYDFRARGEDLITVAFNPKTETLDSIYLKAAGNVIEHILAENGGSLRSAARNLGVEHTTLSRIMKKFKSTSEVKIFPIQEQKFAVAA
ncbi:MAG TPA: sigma 54-interacting transcriptional regulator [Pyrinomonadaceae bacterium]|nr:sigma 54-interacting transcriptional regulator [Pyrinomonadaceae bacterium]